MALVGPDGNDMPETLADGVTAYDYVALRSRLYTEHNREAFEPSFGIGLVHALRTPTLTPAQIADRFQASLAGDVLELDTVTVEVDGDAYDISLRLEVK